MTRGFPAIELQSNQSIGIWTRMNHHQNNPIHNASSFLLNIIDSVVVCAAAAATM
jgi:hypothetical protein